MAFPYLIPTITTTFLASSLAFHDLRRLQERPLPFIRGHGPPPRHYDLLREARREGDEGTHQERPVYVPLRPQLPPVNLQPPPVRPSEGSMGLRRLEREEDIQKRPPLTFSIPELQPFNDTKMKRPQGDFKPSERVVEGQAEGTTTRNDSTTHWWPNWESEVWYDPRYARNHRWGHEEPPADDLNDPRHRAGRRWYDFHKTDDFYDMRYLKLRPLEWSNQRRALKLPSKSQIKDRSDGVVKSVWDGGPIGLMSLFVSSLTVLLMASSVLGKEEITEPFTNLGQVTSNLRDQIFGVGDPIHTERDSSGVSAALSSLSGSLPLKPHSNERAVSNSSFSGKVRGKRNKRKRRMRRGVIDTDDFEDEVENDDNREPVKHELDFKSELMRPVFEGWSQEKQTEKGNETGSETGKNNVTNTGNRQLETGKQESEEEGIRKQEQKGEKTGDGTEDDRERINGVTGDSRKVREEEIQEFIIPTLHQGNPNLLSTTGRQFDPLSQIAFSAAMVLGAYMGYAFIDTNNNNNNNNNNKYSASGNLNKNNKNKNKNKNNNKKKNVRSDLIKNEDNYDYYDYYDYYDEVGDGYDDDDDDDDDDSGDDGGVGVGDEKISKPESSTPFTDGGGGGGGGGDSGGGDDYGDDGGDSLLNPSQPFIFPPLLSLPPSSSPPPLISLWKDKTTTTTTTTTRQGQEDGSAQLTSVTPNPDLLSFTTPKNIADQWKDTLKIATGSGESEPDILSYFTSMNLDLLDTANFYSLLLGRYPDPTTTTTTTTTTTISPVSIPTTSPFSLTKPTFPYLSTVSPLFTTESPNVKPLDNTQSPKPYSSQVPLPTTTSPFSTTKPTFPYLSTIYPIFTPESPNVKPLEITKSPKPHSTQVPLSTTTSPFSTTKPTFPYLSTIYPIFTPKSPDLKPLESTKNNTKPQYTLLSTFQSYNRSEDSPLQSPTSTHSYGGNGDFIPQSESNPGISMAYSPFSSTPSLLYNMTRAGIQQSVGKPGDSNSYSTFLSTIQTTIRESEIKPSYSNPYSPFLSSTQTSIRKTEIKPSYSKPYSPYLSTLSPLVDTTETPIVESESKLGDSKPSSFLSTSNLHTRHQTALDFSSSSPLYTTTQSSNKLSDTLSGLSKHHSPFLSTLSLQTGTQTSGKQPESPLALTNLYSKFFTTTSSSPPTRSTPYDGPTVFSGQPGFSSTTKPYSSYFTSVPRRNTTSEDPYGSQEQPDGYNFSPGFSSSVYLDSNTTNLSSSHPPSPTIKSGNPLSSYLSTSLRPPTTSTSSLYNDENFKTQPDKPLRSDSFPSYIPTSPKPPTSPSSFYTPGNFKLQPKKPLRSDHLPSYLSRSPKPPPMSLTTPKNLEIQSDKPLRSDSFPSYLSKRPKPLTMSLNTPGNLKIQSDKPLRSDPKHSYFPKATSSGPYDTSTILNVLSGIPSNPNPFPSDFLSPYFTTPHSSAYPSTTTTQPTTTTPFYHSPTSVIIQPKSPKTPKPYLAYAQDKPSMSTTPPPAVISHTLNFERDKFGLDVTEKPALKPYGAGDERPKPPLYQQRNKYKEEKMEKREDMDLYFSSHGLSQKDSISLPFRHPTTAIKGVDYLSYLKPGGGVEGSSTPSYGSSGYDMTSASPTYVTHISSSVTPPVTILTTSKPQVTPGEVHESSTPGHAWGREPETAVMMSSTGMPQDTKFGSSPAPIFSFPSSLDAIKGYRPPLPSPRPLHDFYDSNPTYYLNKGFSRAPDDPSQEHENPTDLRRPGSFEYTRHREQTQGTKKRPQTLQYTQKRPHLVYSRPAEPMQNDKQRPGFQYPTKRPSLQFSNSQKPVRNNPPQVTNQQKAEPQKSHHKKPSRPQNEAKRPEIRPQIKHWGQAHTSRPQKQENDPNNPQHSVKITPNDFNPEMRTEEDEEHEEDGNGNLDPSTIDTILSLAKREWANLQNHQSLHSLPLADRFTNHRGQPIRRKHLLVNRHGESNPGNSYNQEYSKASSTWNRRSEGHYVHTPLVRSNKDGNNYHPPPGHVQVPAKISPGHLTTVMKDTEQRTGAMNTEYRAVDGSQRITSKRRETKTRTEAMTTPPTILLPAKQREGEMDAAATLDGFGSHSHRLGEPQDKGVPEGYDGQREGYSGIYREDNMGGQTAGYGQGHGAGYGPLYVNTDVMRGYLQKSPRREEDNDYENGSDGMPHIWNSWTEGKAISADQLPAMRQPVSDLHYNRNQDHKLRIPDQIHGPKDQFIHSADPSSIPSQSQHESSPQRQISNYSKQRIKDHKQDFTDYLDPSTDHFSSQSQFQQRSSTVGPRFSIPYSSSDTPNREDHYQGASNKLASNDHFIHHTKPTSLRHQLQQETSSIRPPLRSPYISQDHQTPLKAQQATKTPEKLVTWVPYETLFTWGYVDEEEDKDERIGVNEWEGDQDIDESGNENMKTSVMAQRGQEDENDFDRTRGLIETGRQVENEEGNKRTKQPSLTYERLKNSPQGAPQLVLSSGYGQTEPYPVNQVVKDPSLPGLVLSRPRPSFPQQTSVFRQATDLPLRPDSLEKHRANGLSASNLVTSQQISAFRQTTDRSLIPDIPERHRANGLSTSNLVTSQQTTAFRQTKDHTLKQHAKGLPISHLPLPKSTIVTSPELTFHRPSHETTSRSKSKETNLKGKLVGKDSRQDITLSGHVSINQLILPNSIKAKKVNKQGYEALPHTLTLNGLFHPGI